MRFFATVNRLVQPSELTVGLSIMLLNWDCSENTTRLGLPHNGDIMCETYRRLTSNSNPVGSRI